MEIIQTLQPATFHFLLRFSNPYTTEHSQPYTGDTYRIRQQATQPALNFHNGNTAEPALSFHESLFKMSLKYL